MLASIATTAVALALNFRAFEAFGSSGSVAMDGLLMGEEPAEIRVGTLGQEGLTGSPVSTRMPRSGAEIPKRRAGGAIRSLALMLEDWLPAFSGQASLAPTLFDGHRVQRIIDAARRSSDGAGWVSL